LGRPALPADRALPGGLTEVEAARRLSVDGPNALPSDGDRHWLRILASQIASPLVLILVVAALLARLLGERVEAVVILLIVALNALLGFVQEHRAERSLRALRGFITRTARARRDGILREVPAQELVRGDVVDLEVGNLIPADLRLLTVAAGVLAFAVPFTPVGQHYFGFTPCRCRWWPPWARSCRPISSLPSWPRALSSGASA
jgi:magnesium-transporting ATPase (P-type)